MYTYRYRNQLNIEYLEIRDRFRSSKEINCVVLMNDRDLYTIEPDNFEDFSEKIVETIENAHSETREKIEHL